jgi:tRNA (guanine-N(7)-)-methyltransferase subunit TRM82
LKTGHVKCTGSAKWESHEITTQFRAAISKISIKMAMPYHCIKRCGSVLVAARGSSIDSFNPEDGSLLSTWKCPCPSAQEGNNKEPNIAYPSTGTLSTALDTQKPELSIDVVLESSPPTKRRKLSTVEDDAQKPPAKNGAKKEQKSAKKGNRRSDAIVSGLETAAVIALAATEEGRHVIAVTGEDKSIRVFETTVDDDGKQCLKQLSQRSVVFS